MPTPSPSDRCSAALIASAVGDALGAPTEFMTRSKIDALVGTNGVRTFLESPPGITDDTQMLLFTAEGLLHHVSHNVSRPVSHTVYDAYRWWLKTQEAHIEVDVDAYPSALFADPRMHRRRAPGYTCITSLRDHTGPGTRANPRNDSKGCGTVMRIAPVGMIYRQHDDQFVFDLGADISAITHGHPTGYLAGGAMALIVKHLVNGNTLDHAINAAMICLYAQPEHHARETMSAIARGYDVGTTQPLTTTMLDGLGGGWTAEEALSIAIAAAASCNGSTMDALAICAAINGDSDSVASMAGTLCGAMYGVGEEVNTLFSEIFEFDIVAEVIRGTATGTD